MFSQPVREDAGLNMAAADMQNVQFLLAVMHANQERVELLARTREVQTIRPQIDSSSDRNGYRVLCHREQGHTHYNI